MSRILTCALPFPEKLDHLPFGRCTSADVPSEVVYAVVKGVFDNFEEFKTLIDAELG